MRKLTNEEKKLVSWMPNKLWFSLRECSEMKGIRIKTLYNHKELQPKKGLGEYIGGRKQFRRDDVIEWLFKSDVKILCGDRR